MVWPLFDPDCRHAFWIKVTASIKTWNHKHLLSDEKAWKWDLLYVVLRYMTITEKHEPVTTNPDLRNYRINQRRPGQIKIPHIAEAGQSYLSTGTYVFLLELLYRFVCYPSTIKHILHASAIQRQKWTGQSLILN